MSRGPVQVHAVKKGYLRFQEADVIFAKITPCMENGNTAPALGGAGRLCGRLDRIPCPAALVRGYEISLVLDAAPRIPAGVRIAT